MSNDVERSLDQRVSDPDAAGFPSDSSLGSGNAQAVGDAAGTTKQRGWFPGRKKRPHPIGKALEYGSLAVIAIILASLIRSFIGLAFYIPSESMVPTLLNGDRVVVSRLSYRIGDPKRGDVVVFRNPSYQATEKTNALWKVHHALFEVVGARQPRDKNYIKRIVGLPGEKLSIRDGKVWINGKPLDEPWLAEAVRTDWPEGAGRVLSIPKGRYFLMGDNRPFSQDSRYFTGPDKTTAQPFVERDAIVGRAFVRMWPLNRLGWL